MCTQDKDNYSCGHGTKHPRRDCYGTTPGYPCRKRDFIVTTRDHNYPCDTCDRIRDLEKDERNLREEIARLRMWSGPMNQRYREKDRERVGLSSQIDELKRSFRFAD